MLDDLDDVKFLCQLYEQWYLVSTKHLTFAYDAQVGGIDRILDIQATYTQFTEVIGEVRQKIAIYETKNDNWLTTVASQMFKMTH